MRLPGINGSISNWTVCPSPQKFKQLRPGDLVRMDYFTRREFTSIMPQVQIRGHVLWCVDEELAIAWLTHTEKDTKYEPPPVVVIAWKDVRTVLEVIYHWRNTTREGFDTSWSVDIEGILYAR